MFTFPFVPLPALEQSAVTAFIFPFDAEVANIAFLEPVIIPPLPSVRYLTRVIVLEGFTVPSGTPLQTLSKFIV